MADLSAVLRKTIDGLPHPTPQMRAKVYEKARAAIARQIQAANPPLAEETALARREALEEAIERTESYYTATDALADEHLGEPAEEPPPPAVPERPQPSRATPVLPRAEAPPRPSTLAPTTPPPVSTPIPAPPAPMPSVADGPKGTVPPAKRTDVVPDEALPNAKRPGRPDVQPRVNPGSERPGSERIEPKKAPARAALDRANAGFVPLPVVSETEPASGLDTSAIPAADLAGPRYPAGRRTAGTRRRSGGSMLLAGVAALILVGIGVAGFVYRDQLSALLGPNGQTGIASTDMPAPGVTPTTPGDTATVTATPGNANDGTAAPAAATPTPTRRFTQRLLPDGTEVDEGPGTGNANAFEEGTNIAAAIPAPVEAPTVVPPAAPPAATATPPVLQAPSHAATPPPAAAPGVPAVAQKAVFYEERSQNEEGTQQSGNVVWSVVEEAPAEGLPVEPAIRAVADIPGDNVKLTLTIRRNGDQTLPASHVIELMFDVPPTFPGGQIANVQRLALKPTEQARGEPLVGVAGKISDGFFIIALNNLAQATQTNMNLLSKEQWIDIPLAYATGRRALLSIEKGIPGDRVFKQAMDAWAASKT